MHSDRDTGPRFLWRFQHVGTGDHLWGRKRYSEPRQHQGELVGGTLGQLELPGSKEMPNTPHTPSAYPHPGLWEEQNRGGFPGQCVPNIVCCQEKPMPV